MKKKRTGYKIGILFILLMGGYLLITNTTRDNVSFVFTVLVAVGLFVFFAYWRLFNFYLLEKKRETITNQDFIDYLEEMDLYDSMPHFVMPSPILKNLETKEENLIRIQINISTFLFYLSFGLFIFLLRT